MKNKGKITTKRWNQRQINALDSKYEKVPKVNVRDFLSFMEAKIGYRVTEAAIYQHRAMEWNKLNCFWQLLYLWYLDAD